jgi:DUF1707 SHOCT-like domain
MSEPCGPSWAGRYTRGHRASSANPGMRVSDAERTEVADRLSKHYSDGRLDEAEFSERLDKAMKAKTQSDLSGLFADLPNLPGGPATEARPPARREHRRLLRTVLFLVLVIAIASAASHAVTHLFMPFFMPWLLIGLLAFLWLRHGPWRQRH